MNHIRLTRKTFSVNEYFFSILNKLYESDFNLVIKTVDMDEAYILIDLRYLKIDSIPYGLIYKLFKGNDFLQVSPLYGQLGLVEIAYVQPLFFDSIEKYLWNKHLYRISSKHIVPIEGLIGYLRYLKTHHTVLFPELQE